MWVDTYRQTMRAPIFTGFLTLGSFLLTLQAVIILRIKEIYDTPDYTADWIVFREQMKNSGGKAPMFYQPLKNLGVVLLGNVFLAIVSAILQMSLGLVNSACAVGVCLAFATVTLLTLLWVWWFIASNLIRWFSVIEQNRRVELEKKGKGGILK